MDRKQTNRVTMFKTVENYLDRNQAVWSAMVPCAEAVALFKDKLNAIDAAAQRQEMPLAGASEDKGEARDALEDVLFLTCEALGVLAHRSGDNDLKALVDVSPSTLGRLDDEELSNRATTLLERVNAMKTELATMLVTQANIDELEDAVQGFQRAKARPRSAVVERAVQTQSLSTLLLEANDVLRDQIDRSVNLFRRSNLEFVSGYRSARVVVDRVATHAVRPQPAPQPQPAP